MSGSAPNQQEQQESTNVEKDEQQEWLKAYNEDTPDIQQLNYLAQIGGALGIGYMVERARVYNAFKVLQEMKLNKLPVTSEGVPTGKVQGLNLLNPQKFQEEYSSYRIAQQEIEKKKKRAERRGKPSDTSTVGIGRYKVTLVHDEVTKTGQLLEVTNVLHQHIGAVETEIKFRNAISIFGLQGEHADELRKNADAWLKKNPGRTLDDYIAIEGRNTYLRQEKKEKLSKEEKKELGEKQKKIWEKNSSSRQDAMVINHRMIERGEDELLKLLQHGSVSEKELEEIKTRISTIGKMETTERNANLQRVVDGVPTTNQRGDEITSFNPVRYKTPLVVDPPPPPVSTPQQSVAPPVDIPSPPVQPPPSAPSHIPSLPSSLNQKVISSLQPHFPSFPAFKPLSSMFGNAGKMFGGAGKSLFSNGLKNLFSKGMKSLAGSLAKKGLKQALANAIAPGIGGLASAALDLLNGLINKLLGVNIEKIIIRGALMIGSIAIFLPMIIVLFGFAGISKIFPVSQQNALVVQVKTSPETSWKHFENTYLTTKPNVQNLTWNEFESAFLTQDSSYLSLQPPVEEDSQLP